MTQMEGPGATVSPEHPEGIPRRHHGAAPAHAGVAIAAPRFEAALDMLERRRSLPLRSLVEPGPMDDELHRMLAIAARVPDHGRLVPWRFIVVAGEARAAAGARMDALYKRQNPDLPESKADMWRLYMLRAPVTVVLVSRPDAAAKVPVFNQILSAGAAGMALVSAASALGYGAQWLLKWPGRDPEAAALLGVGAGEQVAGFIHLGSPAEQPADRPRPAADAVVTVWQPAAG
ncbi:nitroreductase [Azorhizobium oxalatiphilum]|uniref:Putative NAD(P)H nitroreductase n=1 Tax=Azorhizobium oxalatiphilum TaxID=980631 RepID=A0A917CB17_9HYPH|nr:nitroreductase family protein [Azorhizobium oxalatiphilum]GGF79151.1 nitroreductase [Azorhizobium oxalatiphilum]